MMQTCLRKVEGQTQKYISAVFSSISFDKFHHQSCCAMIFLFKRFQSPEPPGRDFSTTLGLGVCHLGPKPHSE